MVTQTMEAITTRTPMTIPSVPKFIFFRFFPFTV